MTEPTPLIVTDNSSMKWYLIERCGLPATTEVKKRVTPEDIQGRHVYGHLPPELAQHADRISELAVDGRGIRMSKMNLAQLRYFGREIVTYRVEVIATQQPPPRR